MTTANAPLAEIKGHLIFGFDNPAPVTADVAVTAALADHGNVLMENAYGGADLHPLHQGRGQRARLPECSGRKK